MQPCVDQFPCSLCKSCDIRARCKEGSADTDSGRTCRDQSRRLAGPGHEVSAALITTGNHDDRVLPAHSYKFAAAMRNAPAGDAPVLIRIETRTGHGQSRPTTKQIDLAADQRDASYCASRW
jgi:hypothetical protein